MNIFSDKRVFKNLFSLAVLQAGNYLLPIIQIPYLVHALGLEKFGEWMFALSFIIIFRICVSYGFDLTATREVPDKKTSPQKLSELLVDIVVIRLSIFCICVVLMILLSVMLPLETSTVILIFLGLPILIGEALFPIWLFHGMERMGSVTIFRLGGKVISLLLIIYSVRTPSDLIYVPLIESVVGVLTGTLAIVVACRKFNLLFVKMNIVRMRQHIVNGKGIFVSTLAVQLYTTLNMLLLGFMIDNQAVGVYSLAEKIYSAIRGMTVIICQAIFPKLTSIYDTNRNRFESTVLMLIKLIILMYILIGVALYFFSSLLIYAVTGEYNTTAIQLLQLFSISMPLAMGSFLVPLLVIKGEADCVMRVSIVGGVIGMLLAPPLIYFYGVYGAVFLFVIVQLYNSAALLKANNIIYRITLMDLGNCR